MTYCTAFVNTPMGHLAEQMVPEIVAAVGGLIEVEKVGDVFVKLLTDDTNAGKAMATTKMGSFYYPFNEQEVLLSPATYESS